MDVCKLSDIVQDLTLSTGKKIRIKLYFHTYISLVPRSKVIIKLVNYIYQ